MASDILWVNSAGNGAQETWFGGYSDPDGDGIIGFDSRNDEVLDMPLRACQRYVVQLRWEDNWDGASTDLDLYLYDAGTRAFVLSSRGEQTGESGQVPYEWLSFTSRIDTEALGIVLDHHGGDVPDWIQLLVWGVDPIQHHTGNGSINNPSESDNPGMLAVGAAPWYDVHTIEPFSSRGPTPDGRPKPDIVGADCGETALRPLNERRRGFCGTSQAAPHVAGVAALVRQRFPEKTPSEVAEYLKDHTERRGTVPNNTWGYGFAHLPPHDAVATPVSPAGMLVSAEPNTAGSATRLTVRFTTGSNGALSEDDEIIVTAPDFGVPVSIDSADVMVNGASPKSVAVSLNTGEIILTLSSPIPTNRTVSVVFRVSAGITNPSNAGTFTLSVSTTAESAAASAEVNIVASAIPPTDNCVDDLGALAGTVTRDGTWTGDCDSSNRSGRHARFYSFTLEQETEVTVTLESGDADTYLYLLAGAGADGNVLADNDDAEAGNIAKSQIQDTLVAGTYTAEATTYAAGATGDFTLTITPAGTTTAPTPPEPSDPCGQALTGDGTVSGQWAEGCQSEVSGRGYARYYGFTLAQESEVTITLESQDADTYLYLRRGETRSGAFLYENDDDGGITRSRIQDTLAAGTYTIEATTYDEGQAGSFTLTISGLGATAPPPGPTPSDSCEETLTADVTVSGQWAEGCQSEVSGRGYARYYGFTLAQESEVTITLESQDADTYLYLRRGETRSGDFLYENDDDGGTTRSRIQETLVAGTYAIEATTYDEGQAGSFTLTVGGLGAIPAVQSCSVGLTLAPGEGCGHQDFTIEVDSSGTLLMRFTGNRVDFDSLLLVRSGNSWSIESLP